MTHDEIVSGYIRKYRDDAREEIRGFENERSPSAAIRRAALRETQGGKRHAHQWRIPKALLGHVEIRRQVISRNLARAADFNALHKLVEKEIGGIKGIGTHYGVRHCTPDCAYFRKAPEHVYLHAGTMIGARAFGIEGDSFDPKALPQAFSRLSPAEIEDCLFIYKEELYGADLKRDGSTGCRVVRRKRCYPV